jgi:hypothetical protein
LTVDYAATESAAICLASFESSNVAAHSDVEFRKANSRQAIAQFARIEYVLITSSRLLPSPAAVYRLQIDTGDS